MNLKLSVSDLPMLSCHYIQQGCLFTRPHLLPHALLSHFKHSLSLTLSHFPPLAGRLSTSNDGYVFLSCNDAGADFVFADAKSVHVSDVLAEIHQNILQITNYNSYIKPVSTNYSSSSKSCRSFTNAQTNSNLAPSPISYPMRIAVSPGKVHQVFLNFRGEQLRYNFVSHLSDAFQRHEIKFFIDKYEQRGKDLKHLFF